jgi:hypothetical protein
VPSALPRYLEKKKETSQMSHILVTSENVSHDALHFAVLTALLCHLENGREIADLDFRAVDFSHVISLGQISFYCKLREADTTLSIFVN